MSFEKVSLQQIFWGYFRGSVIPSVWKHTLIMMVFALIITLLYMQGLEILDQPILVSLIPGVVLGLLLVFRTNTAYERFWEGRKLIGGIIVTARSLARQVWVNIPEKSAQDCGDKLIFIRLISAFFVAMKLHLRQESIDEQLSLLLTEEQTLELSQTNKMPLKITQWMSSYFLRWYQSGYIDSYQLISYNSLLNQLIEYLTGCERVRNTPIPKAYASHLSHLLFLYCMAIPFQLVATLKWWTPPVAGLICFTLVGIEAIGLEIENPFGNDLNDIPLDNLCNNLYLEIDELYNYQSQYRPINSKNEPAPLNQ